MEEEIRRMRISLCNFAKEIDFKNMLLEDGEETCSKLSSALYKAKEENNEMQREKNELQRQLDVKNQLLEQMKIKCNDLSTALNRAIDQKNGLIERHAEAMRRMRSETSVETLTLYQENRSLRQENKQLKVEIECVLKQVEDQAKDRERIEDEINLKKHYVTFAKKELKNELETMEEKENDVEYWEQQSQVLAIIQRKSNDELQEVRTALLDGFSDYLSTTKRCANRILGIKRMGELDSGLIHEACRQKLSDEEIEIKSAELCSFWQTQIANPQWHPFRISSTGSQEIDPEDEKLKSLKEKWGDKVFDAVSTALLEMNEYNASGRYAVCELWNFKENRKASLKETIVYIINELKNKSVYSRKVRQERTRMNR